MEYIYTERSWCTEAVEEPAKGDVGRYYQEEVRVIEQVVSMVAVADAQWECFYKLFHKVCDIV